MTLDYDQTKVLIELTFSELKETAKKKLGDYLQLRKRTFPEFYDSVIKHGPKMPFTSEQWFVFHQKIDHWRLREEKALMDKLSPNQKEILGIDI